ncbi:NACHT, LRR and PYD domains-containing protein 1a-like isoform X2 [Pelodiscus sinensis]|uniref:NACHT, LRR and PYD domains-containing protein 1a-like isoform X2 n=1 Tax=Pelodiscus sinensis TaxID=13735 RepID=UPI003F6C9517
MEPTRPGKSAATIFVKTLTGESLSVAVCLDETVLDLKRKIEAQEGTPVDQMRLIASNPGRQLNNDWTLRRSGLTDGCVVHLVLRLRGGGDITTTPLLPVSDFPTVTAPGKGKSQLLHPASPDTEESEAPPRVRRTVGPFRSCALLKEKCKRCVGETLPEVTPQIVLDPERNKTIYRAHLPHAGSFHCTETGLGFEVSAAVTVEYSYGSWAESLSPSAQENWMVAGPLFHIRAEPHRVRAVHLPHFVCLADGADESLCRIAHFEAGRMTPERPTSINRFFAVLKKPNFSQLGVVWRKLRSAFKFIPIHSLVLIYRTLSMADVTLHLYLIPNDHSLQKTLPEVTPEIVLDPERNKTVYRAHLPHAGSFHCAETGLGFEVSAAVTVEYSYGSWAESLSPSAQENWMVAGPLFHIRAEPHRVRAVHLPHFVCLADGADESLCRIAHFEAGQMTPERPTSINRFFAVLKNPSFSQLGVLWRKLRSALTFIPIHSLVLIYRTLSMADVTLHLYLIPNDHSLKKAIEEEETTWKSTHVPKPPQTNPLYFGSRYQVSGLENLEITPAQLDFCYWSPGEQQSFVEIYTREMKKEIQLKVKGQEDGSLVWETLVRPGDVRLPASPSIGLPGAAFVAKHRLQLRDRMGLLESVLARFRDAQLLNSEEEEEVKSHQTSKRRNDALLQLVERKGIRAQEKLYQILRETDPCLVEDLEASQ